MNDKKYKEILCEIQKCFQELDLPLMREREESNDDLNPGRFVFNSWCKNESGLAHITASLFKDQNVIDLTITNSKCFPESIWPMLYDLFNFINMTQPYGRWIINPFTRQIEYRSAVLVAESGFNKDQFKTILIYFMRNSSRFYPLIEEKMSSDGEPEILLGKFLHKNPDLLEGGKSSLS